MKYNKTFRSLAAFLLALVLMVMMATVCVNAEADAADDAAAADTSAADDAAAADTSATDDDAAAETSAADAADTSAADDKKDDTSDDKKDEKKLSTFFWVSLGIFGAAIIAGVIVGIIKRDKLKVWWKSYKSELKKIVWMPWPQVRKNSIVVIVVVVALAAVIGLLDFAFSKGIIALGSLF